jgi:hypothetical protein
MPLSAQWIGEIIPMTHAVRMVRGILLKGNGVTEILSELWPMALFTLAAIAAAVFARMNRTRHRGQGCAVHKPSFPPCRLTERHPLPELLLEELTYGVGPIA